MKNFIDTICTQVYNLDITQDDELIILAGHAPIDYFKEKINWALWGDFSETTLEIASEVSQSLDDIKTKILILIDDKPTTQTSKYLKSSQLSKIRKKVYHSEKEQQKLFELLEKYNISSDQIIRQQHDKNHLNGNIFHSELAIGKEITGNLCADAYINLYENYGNNGAMLSFVPRVCQGNICEIGFEHHNFHGKNCSVFLETGVDKKDLLQYPKIIIS